ncbi:Hachiman anti-phage system protein HamA [Bacillus toyonensis]|uniref:Hachiman anti-phage system protein HamA n=1 Tax=Bacillus toyonensis TaxID=155322 RepID=UPI002E1B89A7|nr:Hachiman anti-phage system protein HamA [Bacillus toyonensis]MED2688620.1 SAVED domain-containing protein [Bacillus toyonensis]
MTIQDDMVGQHPIENDFWKWLQHEDTESSDLKRHRYLEVNSSNLDEAIKSVAAWLIKYHLSEGKKRVIRKKQEILEKHDFAEYAQSLHVFPKSDKTQKGNLGEIFLSEYLSQTSGVQILVYKLHYNPNIDQSMKGDDVLLVNSNKVLLGESKFRSTPNKRAVEEASELMKDKLTMPMSLGFIADRLFEQGKDELGEVIFDLQFKMSSIEIDIKNIGFLLSTKKVRGIVENNLSSPNSDFIFISLGMDDPAAFLKSVFDYAESNLLEGSYET